MKRAVLALLVAIALMVMTTMPVFAGGEVGVDATVTALKISVKIADGWPTAVDYGALGPDTTGTPTSYSPATYDYLKVENDGDMDENLLIKGADATYSTYTWTLGTASGDNEYVHNFGISQTPSSYTPLDSTGTQVLGGNVPQGGSVSFNLQITTPTSSDAYATYSTTVTIIATAS